MGAASTFIKEGSHHISIMQTMATWGVMNGTVVFLLVCIQYDCHGVEWGGPDVLLHSRYTTDLNSSVPSVVVSWSHCICLINTQHSLVNKVKPKRISCGLLRIASFFFCLSIVFRFLASPSSRRFSFVFCSLPMGFYIIHERHIVFGWCRIHVFPPILPITHIHSPHQSLIYNLAGLNFRITVGYCVHNSCSFHFHLII